MPTLPILTYGRSQHQSFRFPSSNTLLQLRGKCVPTQRHLSCPSLHCTPHLPTTFLTIPLPRNFPIWKCRALPCITRSVQHGSARQCTVLLGNARYCPAMHGNASYHIPFHCLARMGAFINVEISPLTNTMSVYLYKKYFSPRDVT